MLLSWHWANYRVRSIEVSGSSSLKVQGWNWNSFPNVEKICLGVEVQQQPPLSRSVLMLCLKTGSWCAQKLIIRSPSGSQCHTLMSLGEGWRWGQSLPKRVALEKVFPRFSSSTVFHSNCRQQERSRGGKWGLVTGANYCSKLNILHVQEVPPTKEWEQTLVPERGGYHPGRATKSNRAIAESTSRGCVMMQWVQSVRNFP